MANPADEAAVLAARANEEASRTYATGILATAEENYQLFKETAEQKLAERYVMYAKSGNVSTGTEALPDSGVPVGSPVSEELTKKRDEINARIAEIEAERGTATRAEKRGGRYKDLTNELEGLQENLEALGTGAENLATIRSNAATGHLSGSDLLTEVSFRDLAQRHGYTQMRSAENQAVAAITQAQNFNTQAQYLEDAAKMETWNSILGVGMTVLGGVLTAVGLGAVGVPLMTTGIGVATS